MRRLLLATILLGALGCTDARMAAIRSGGRQHCVHIFSGGKEVATFTSTGIVTSEGESDGYFFEDLKTGNLVEFSGTHYATIGACQQ
jgi:hypothetical protein